MFHHRYQSNRPASVSLYDIDFEERYANWRGMLANDKEHPTAEQWRILYKVHHRCLLEHALEAGLPMQTEEEPLLELIHGLPGSGKSKVIGWIRSYLEYVWQWQHGVHFVCLAPMNSMATNIGGFTVHSFGEVPFMKDGVYISTAKNDGKSISSMVTKCQKLRFLIIDEVENLGAGCLADLEANVFAGMPDAWYKYKEGAPAAERKRLFGGLNVLLVGDFWQLDPVAEIAIMKNPFRGGATLSEKAQQMLHIFWGEGPRTLTKPPLELTVNIRNGADVWYAAVIEECRKGKLTEENYNFLHGYPTEAVGSYMAATGTTQCGDPACEKLMRED